MAKTALRGNPVTLEGQFPVVGEKAPDSLVTSGGLGDVTLSSISGKKLLNIFPSVDTGVCATSVRTFNKRAAATEGVKVLNISADLPFAQKRFCAAEGIENVENYSSFRSNFAKEFGVHLADGPLAGLCARAVVVLDNDNKVLYTEMVADISQEPNYDAALAALS